MSTKLVINVAPEGNPADRSRIEGHIHQSQLQANENFKRTHIKIDDVVRKINAQSNDT